MGKYRKTGGRKTDFCKTVYTESDKKKSGKGKKLKVKANFSTV